MKFLASIVGSLALIQLSLAGPISEMSNDTLAEAFRGRHTPGFSEDAIKKELSGTEATVLAQRWMQDDRLKPALSSYVQHIVELSLKDRVIDFVLSEPGVWEIDSGYDALDPSQWMQSSQFVSTTLRQEFFLEQNDPLVHTLERALLDKSNRYLVAKIFQEVRQMDREKRTKDDPGMVAVVSELRQTMARLEKKGQIPFSEASRPERKESRVPLPAVQDSPKDSRPVSTAPSSTAGEEKGNEEASVSVPKWIAGVSAVLLAMAGFVAFRRKLARA